MSSLGVVNKSFGERRNKVGQRASQPKSDLQSWAASSRPLWDFAPPVSLLTDSVLCLPDFGDSH